MDVFGQIYILDMGAALGKYITHFRNTYFYPSGYGGYDWKLQDGAEKKIQAKIKPLVMRLAADDYLELPELIYNRIDVELPKDARAIYDEMERELWTMVGKDSVTAVNAAVASGKCRQIANGGLYKEDGSTIHIHDEKTDAVVDLVEQVQGSPVLIGYEFHHDLARLEKAFGSRATHMGGSGKAAAEIEAAWNAGEIPILLGNPASMGHGLNLQDAGNHVVWYSLTWNFENYDQFIKRIRRQGSQHKKVFVHHIMAENTIDDVVLMSLKSKDFTQQSLLFGLREYLSNKMKKGTLLS